MTTEEQKAMGALALALSKAQGEIRGATKDKLNPAFKQGSSPGSKYADLTSVWEACRAALSANGLAVAQVLDSDAAGNVFVRTVLMHAEGASLEGRYPVKPSQATPQGYGSAITYARRYALAAMVGVAPEDDDGNAGSQGGEAPPASLFVRRLSEAKTLDELEVIRAEIGQHVQTYPRPQQEALGLARDAALERLTPASPAAGAFPPDVTMSVAEWESAIAATESAAELDAVAKRLAKVIGKFPKKDQAALKLKGEDWRHALEEMATGDRAPGSDEGKAA